MKNGEAARPFYEDENAYKKCGIISLVGCALMFIAAFLYWKSLYINNGERSYEGVSFFEAARRGISGMFIRDLDGNITEKIFSISGILPMLFLILYIAVIVVLAMAGYKDNIARVPFLMKWRKRTRFVLLMLSLVMVILIVHTSVFKGIVTDFKELHDTWSVFIEGMKSSSNPQAAHMKSIYLIGPGFIAYIVGFIAYLFSIAYNFVLDTLNEDD